MLGELSRYKELFLSEAKARLKTMSAALLKLEKSPGNRPLLQEIFRAAHTLKGMAATMKYDRTAALCHAIEDLLDAIRKNKVRLEGCVDPLFQCFDALEGTVKALEANTGEPDTGVLVDRLQKLAKRREGRRTEDELGAMTDEREGSAMVEKIQAIEVKVERLDRLMNLAEELLMSKMRLERLRESLESPELFAAVDTLARFVTELQYSVMQVRLVPFAMLFDRFPRMVRDLARQQRKEVELRFEGGAIELDRSVIDAIGESLVHLLRNAVDHGIESPEERLRQGKPGSGTIRLSVHREREHAVIEVADDGAGLNLDAVKAAAIKRGLLTPQSTREEAMESVFLGVSTTGQVTSVSGRGLGLNIVKRTVESLGGAVTVRTEPNKGMTFNLKIPLTLALIKTLFVDVGGQTYAIPVTDIERLITVSLEGMKGNLDREAIALNGEAIPITRLNELFGAPKLTLERQPIVILQKGEEKLGLAVDMLLSTQEIVIKPLNKFVRENRYFAGSTIVGSGEVVLILDVANLMSSRRSEAVAA